jgi:hypothetical protein
MPRCYELNDIIHILAVRLVVFYCSIPPPYGDFGVCFELSNVDRTINTLIDISNAHTIREIVAII